MDRPDSDMELILEAQRELGLNNNQLASLLGVSKRTVQRWLVAGCGRVPLHLHTLARALLPANAALAHELDGRARATVEEWGNRHAPLPPLVEELPTPAAAAPVITAPAPPPVLVTQAAGPPTARPEHADSVLLAAANAADLSPRLVLPAVAAALRQALALGVDLESLVKLLEPPPKQDGPGPPK